MKPMKNKNFFNIVPIKFENISTLLNHEQKSKKFIIFNYLLIREMI